MSRHTFDTEILRGIDTWQKDHADRLKNVPGSKDLIKIFKNDETMRDVIAKTNMQSILGVKVPNEAAIKQDLNTILKIAENNPNGFQNLVNTHKQNPEDVAKQIEVALANNDPKSLSSLLGNEQQPTPVQPQQTQQTQAQPQPTQPTTQQPERSLEDLLEATRNQGFSTQQSPIHDENTRTALVNDAKTVEAFDEKTLAMQKALVEKGYSVGEYKNNGSGHKAGDPLLDGREGPLTEAAALKAAKDLGISEDELKNMPIEEFIQKVQDGPENQISAPAAEENTPGFNAAIQNSMTPDDTLSPTQQQQAQTATNAITPDMASIQGSAVPQETQTAPLANQQATIDAITPTTFGSTEIAEDYAQPIALEGASTWDEDTFKQHFIAAAEQNQTNPGGLTRDFGQSASDGVEQQIDNSFTLDTAFKSDITPT